MFNNSTAQPQPQITSASNSSSNRSSRTSNRPSSTSAPQVPLDSTHHGDLLMDIGNQGRGQSHGNTNPWNGATIFTGYGPGNASAGNSSWYPAASAFGQPLPPNFQPGQTGGNHYSGYQLAAAAAAAATNPLSAGYPAYLPNPTPFVYTTPNAQGGSAAGDWQVLCRLVHEAPDEVRVMIVFRRSPPA